MKMQGSNEANNIHRRQSEPDLHRRQHLDFHRCISSGNVLSFLTPNITGPKIITIKDQHHVSNLNDNRSHSTTFMESEIKFPPDNKSCRHVHFVEAKDNCNDSNSSVLSRGSIKLNDQAMRNANYAIHVKCTSSFPMQSIQSKLHRENIVSTSTRANSFDSDSSADTTKVANLSRFVRNSKHSKDCGRATKSTSLSPGFRPKEAISFARMVPRHGSYSAPNTPQSVAQCLEASGNLLEMLSQSFTNMKNLINTNDKQGHKPQPPPRASKNISGATYFRRGQRKAKMRMFPEAVLYFNFALERLRAELGEDHVDCGTTLNEIGKALMMMGERYPALNAFQEAQYIREKAFGSGALEVAEVTSNIWMVLHEQRREMEEDMKRMSEKRTHKD
mmetsp:Transcript_21157/g.41909  ORF Transcript_21157/g.41909 Transcript_21157/m.41909 type:complete len:389 (-) Transcript_21157:28-1194(-)|eukprot:CAMPEP_0171342244 /NCGR_PEP_ID=MMETSP0878-20121228/13796_1 /TAXON_ID=67004 /ORGANISM="Thalassiosira weissflogii, Strain CCMP1336" /LENGTH=388 /DNA_ID=CAMNT_0011844861 /DNA_START=214 /DNA_END=1380 /DNA_ORIENTATION=-